MDQRDKIVITNQELAGIELAAMKAPSKDGSMSPRIVRAFLEYISSTYGISLDIVTEEMENELVEKDRKQPKRGGRLGRKSLRNASDDF